MLYDVVLNFVDVSFVFRWLQHCQWRFHVCRIPNITNHNGSSSISARVSRMTPTYHPLKLASKKSIRSCRKVIHHSKSYSVISVQFLVTPLPSSNPFLLKKYIMIRFGQNPETRDFWSIWDSPSAAERKNGILCFKNKRFSFWNRQNITFFRACGARKRHSLFSTIPKVGSTSF